MHIVLLGPPGAGKGTQASILAEHFDVAHVASGDLFRKHLGESTELGQLAKGYMDKGDLVPDDVTISMVLDRLTYSDASSGYVLDGFPRTLNQAKALDGALIESGATVDVAPLIIVSPEELVRRLSGRWICKGCQSPYHEVSAPPNQAGTCDLCGAGLYQRDDDKSDVVRSRLDTYESQTSPLIEYYENQGKLVKIDGQRDVDDVTQGLISALGR